MQDDFNGSSVDTSIWIPFDGSVGNGGFGLRRASALTVSGGLLNITAQMVDGSLVSSGVAHRVAQTYGRYEFRVRTDKDPSETMSGVVLTWPKSDVHPRDGENNIYETLWFPGDRHEFYSFIHRPFGQAHEQDYTVHNANSSDWHTMVMEWAPNQIKIFRDGALIKELNETTADLIPDVPHLVTIQFDSWRQSIPSPVAMQVDYMKVSSYRPC